jgi:hypothetical protein
MNQKRKGIKIMLVKKLCKAIKAGERIDAGNTAFPFFVRGMTDKELSGFLPFDRNLYSYDVIGFLNNEDESVLVITEIKNPADISSLVAYNLFAGKALREFFTLNCGDYNVAVIYLW